MVICGSYMLELNVRKDMKKKFNNYDKRKFPTDLLAYLSTLNV